MAEGGPLCHRKYPGFDETKPNVARVYDALLGGRDNFAADRECVRRLLSFAPAAPMPRGSYLAISSLRLPGPDLPELRAFTIQGEKLHAWTLGSGWWREDDEILSWFGDWELADPGLVPIVDWRPQAGDTMPAPEVRESFSGGVARKP